MSRSSRLLPFPHNLSPGHRRHIEAVHEHGNQLEASKALQIAPKTLQHSLARARMRAGVETTAELLDRYLATKGNP